MIYIFICLFITEINIIEIKIQINLFVFYTAPVYKTKVTSFHNEATNKNKKYILKK